MARQDPVETYQPPGTVFHQKAGRCYQSVSMGIEIGAIRLWDKYLMSWEAVANTNFSEFHLPKATCNVVTGSVDHDYTGEWDGEDDYDEDDE